MCHRFKNSIAPSREMGVTKRIPHYLSKEDVDACNGERVDQDVKIKPYILTMCTVFSTTTNITNTTTIIIPTTIYNTNIITWTTFTIKQSASTNASSEKI